MNTTSRTTINVLIVIGLAILLFHQCEKRKEAELDLALSKSNLTALNDTIEITKNALGQIQYEKSVLVSSKDGLKDLNADLYNELNAQKGKVAQLTKIVGGINTKHSNPYTGNTSVTGNPFDSIGSYITEWKTYEKYDSINYRKLEGKTTVNLLNKNVSSSETAISLDEIGFDIITGLEKRDDHYEIFVRSNYPGFKPKKIDGAVIPVNDLIPNQPKKKWSVGAGPNISIGTGKNGPGVYIGIGLGIQYSILKF